MFAFLSYYNTSYIHILNNTFIFYIDLFLTQLYGFIFPLSKYYCKSGGLALLCLLSTFITLCFFRTTFTELFTKASLTAEQVTCLFLNQLFSFCVYRHNTASNPFFLSCPENNYKWETPIINSLLCLIMIKTKAKKYIKICVLKLTLFLS